MNETYQFIQYGAYFLLLLLAIYLGSGINKAMIRFHEGKLSGAKAAAHGLGRFFLILVAVWVAFSVQTVTPKTEIKAPSVSHRVNEQQRNAKPAPEVVPVDTERKSLAKDPEERRKEIEELFNALPDDKGPAAADAAPVAAPEAPQTAN